MNVWCEICGAQWDMRDPGVRRIWGDDVWECQDEAQCFYRRAIARALELAVEAEARRIEVTG